METIKVPLKNSYWVLPGRFKAGSYPGSDSEEEARQNIKWLLENDINVFIDLTEPGEDGLKPYAQYIYEVAQNSNEEITYIRMPIEDKSTPPPERIVEVLDVIDASLKKGKNIYMHCQGGKGRTGTMVGCYLVRHGLPGDEALKKLEQLREENPLIEGISPETNGQRKAVEEWIQGQ